MKTRPRYDKKLQLPNGRIVYVYNPAAIASRKRKKLVTTNKLEKRLSELMAAVSSDIRRNIDPALVAACILCTFERVGNAASAASGHYGVSNLERRHVINCGDHLKLRYIGKSGVNQNKIISEPELVRIIQKRLTRLAPDARIFNCTPTEVNQYLAKFDITSKDIRTFAANKFMMDELKDGLSFTEALEKVAAIIGHKPATLRSMYLHDKTKRYAGVK